MRQPTIDAVLAALAQHSPRDIAAAICANAVTTNLQSPVVRTAITVAIKAHCLPFEVVASRSPEIPPPSITGVGWKICN